MTVYIQSFYGVLHICRIHSQIHRSFVEAMSRWFSVLGTGWEMIGPVEMIDVVFVLISDVLFTI